MEASGSCLCGGIRFEVALPGIVINHCHCSRCRKASGGAFGTYFHTRLGAFRWLGGEELIERFQPAAGDPRPFCSRCGSRVPLVEAADDHVIIPAGTFDDDPGLRPSVNIHAASKAPWYTITGDLPTFDEDAPASFWEQFE